MITFNSTILILISLLIADQSIAEKIYFPLEAGKSWQYQCINEFKEDDFIHGPVVCSSYGKIVDLSISKKILIDKRGLQSEHNKFTDLPISTDGQISYIIEGDLIPVIIDPFIILGRQTIDKIIVSSNIDNHEEESGHQIVYIDGYKQGDDWIILRESQILWNFNDVQSYWELKIQTDIIWNLTNDEIIPQPLIVDGTTYADIAVIAAEANQPGSVTATHISYFQKNTGIVNIKGIGMGFHLTNNQGIPTFIRSSLWGKIKNGKNNDKP